ncbi:MAG: DUF1134 domain-containing protein [Novosphingobium sp.]
MMGFVGASFGRGLRSRLAVLAGAALLCTAGVAGAQVQAVNPDQGMNGDLVPRAQPQATAAAPAPVIATAPVAQQDVGTPMPASASASASAKAGETTYHQDDLIGAAEGVFGKGAHGLADVIKDLLKKQGEPNGYIIGREGGGAFVFGLRYGSGTLYHKVEGNKPVYWTGPSIGLDAGANAGNTFVLVYNLYNTDDLYHRFGAGEGQAYLLGGFHVSYLRRGDVVLIPVRVGVGLRLGINAGYMKITRKANWLPF